MEITSLSVWQIDADSPKPTGFGALSERELQDKPEAIRLCQLWVDQLWHKHPDRPDTRVHPFETNGEAAERAEQVKLALWKIARRIDLAENSERIARIISESHWATRYVLLIIGFVMEEKPFVALVLTQSAKSETFAITPERLVSELENIFKKSIDKGVVYPHFLSMRNTQVEDKAKVYQFSYAEYILTELGLVPMLTANEVVVQAIQSLVHDRQIMLAPEFNVMAEQIWEAAASAQTQQPEKILSDVQQATVVVNVDSSVRLHTNLQAVRDGRITIAGTPGNMQVAVSGARVDVKMGGESVIIGGLIRGR